MATKREHIEPQTSNMMIDGRNHKVFILDQTDESALVIPVESLIADDYVQLNKIAAKSTPARPMLQVMCTEKLTNGMYAINRYDKLITLVNKQTKRRVRAPQDMSVIDMLSAERDSAIDAIKAMEATVVNAMNNKPVPEGEQELVKEYFIIVDGEEYTWDGVSNKKKKVREFLETHTINDMETRMVPAKRK